MCFSNSLQRIQVREIGLWFPGADGLVEDLGIGAIMDSFQPSGILPTRMERLNSLVIDGAMQDAVCFNIWAEILSGPQALETSRPCSKCSTSDSVQCIWAREGSCWKDGGGSNGNASGREERIQKHSLLLVSTSSLFALLECGDCRLLLIEVFNSFPKLLWVSRIQVLKIVGFSSAKHTDDPVASRSEFSTVASHFEQRVSFPHCTTDIFVHPWQVPLWRQNLLWYALFHNAHEVWMPACPGKVYILSQ